MFGYIVTNEQELKIKEYRKYRAYYCGLCEALKSRHGHIGQLTLSFDMTFVYILLNALYEPETKDYETHCITHHIGKHRVLKSECADYVADMNIILSYYKCKDDWEDEHRIDRNLEARSLYRAYKRVKTLYPEKVKFIHQKLKAISACEQAKEQNMDIPAGLFGDIMGEILVWKNDEWADTLRSMGFYLGKYVYLLDAYDDQEEDRNKGNYNVFLLRDPDTGLDAKTILTMMMAECSRAFETLPIVQDTELLRNILYSGVWSKFKADTSSAKQEG